jgi:hypothetical protein
MALAVAAMGGANEGGTMETLGGMHMSQLIRRRIDVGLALIFFVAMISLASCTKVEGVAAAKEPVRTFSTPQEAGAALLKAAKSGDQGALLEIFGPNGRDLLFTGDPTIDRNALNDFAAAYEAMNRWRKIEAGGEMLYVGAENFPFPIPLERDAAGQWYFDTASGSDEVLARRIGRNELVAMAALGALANAEQEYFSRLQTGEKVQQYAHNLYSDQGRHNGLYWPVAPGQPESPLGQLGDFAKAPQPFNGYNFRILTKQGPTAKGGARDYIVNGNMTGGFAILAYPAEYQNSGVKSFLLSTDGIIYDKDLGKNTTEIAQAITEYNPGDGWNPVK